MITARLESEDDFDGWRTQCRGLLRLGAKPADVVWQVGVQRTDLFANPESTIEAAPIGVPKGFAELSRAVICHNDPERFGLLFQLLIDLKAGRRHMGDRADPLLRKLDIMAKTVRRDIHKMRAFVRFRRIVEDGEEHYIAWFEPEHHIVRTNASFFVRRFAGMRWSILTPQLSIYWDKDKLLEGPPARKEDAPSEDAIEEQWKTYYGSIFNPARLKVKAMLKEMPKKYWHNMPETALVSELIQSARNRELAMIEKETAAPVADTLASLHAEAVRCRRCPLFAPATQIVFGEGPERARLMFVGEQPGDQEDMQGRPFVGPAGQIFDAALAQAGLDRSQAYVTNAVKHFKFKPDGKRRIHERPNVGEVNHCRWWLTREIEMVQPDLIVALGATAARSLTGRNVAITAKRGSILQSTEGVPVLVTIHPSYLLRLPDAEMAAQERRNFVADLMQARERIETLQMAAT
ncbi:UdgX family uracil-DNA binding protein [Sphingorhabdus sp.]|uniref:UdgX family uracil-DNA binding protein n=1 Tax=Sphingorhabdus sp. TaxID=1902408 RepID=UPI00391DBD2A